MATVTVLRSNMARIFVAMIMMVATVQKQNAHLHHVVMGYVMEMRHSRHVQKIVLQVKSVQIVNLIGLNTALNVVMLHGQLSKFHVLI